MSKEKLKLSDEAVKDLVTLCETLVFEAVQWSPSIHGPESPEVYVYALDEEKAHIALMPVTDDIGWIFERLRGLLTGGEPLSDLDN